LLGRQPLYGRHDETGSCVRLNLAPADHMELHPTASEAAEVVERGGQVSSEAVQVVDDDRPGAGGFHLLGETFEVLAVPSAHAVVGKGLRQRPVAFDAIGRDPSPLVFEAYGPITRLLAPPHVAYRCHVEESYTRRFV